MLTSAPYLALRAPGAAPTGRPNRGARSTARGSVRNSRRLVAFLDMCQRFTYSTSLTTSGTWSFGRGPVTVSLGFLGRNTASRPSREDQPMKRQPVITGLGIVSPIGVGVDKFWASALAGRSGLGTPTLFDASKLPLDCRVVGEVQDFNPLDWMPARVAKMAGRFSQFAVAAAKMARVDSGCDLLPPPPDKIKVAIGTSLNGQADVAQPNYEFFLEGGQIWPWAALEFPAHAATAHVAIDTKAVGQTTTFATACAAGLDAVGWAADQVGLEDGSVILAGATETPLSEFILRVFHAVGVLSKWPGPAAEASRPF